MKYLISVSIVLCFLLLSCTQEGANDHNWVSKPIKDWPDIVLSNDIMFKNGNFKNLASGFLVDTGSDTLAITSKQNFVAFVAVGLTTVDFQDQLIEWEMYPRNHPEERILLDSLINKDPKEFTAMPGGTSTKDWLIFAIKENFSSVKPLKMASGDLAPDEILYTIGWNSPDSRKAEPHIIAGKIIRRFDNQIFFEMQEEIGNPDGYVGSPVFNKKGEVVGVFSRNNESIGISCSIQYLNSILANGVEKK
jgi:hypothetical protein